MIVDENGKPFAGDEPKNLVSFALMRNLLKQATKDCPFKPSKVAQLRQVAKECSRNWEEEKEETLETLHFAVVNGPAWTK